MRLCPLLLSPLLLASLTHCSWVTTFAVLNNSKVPITISYRLPQYPNAPTTCPDDRSFMRPRLRPEAQIEELVNRGGPVAEYQCEVSTRTVTLQLLPGQAVSLFQSGTYTGYYGESNRETQDTLEQSARLTLRSPTGEISYTGSTIARDFVKKSDPLYVLTYY